MAVSLYPVCIGGSYHSSHEEGLYESEQDEEMETEAAATDETTPLMLSPPKRPHPFIYLLLALYPFGEDFRELGLVGKLYELLKVCLANSTVYMCVCVNNNCLTRV